MTDSRLATLQKFLADDPADVFTHYAIALEYVSMEKPSEAIAKFQEVIALDSTYIPAYHQLGLLFLRQNRTAEAQAILGHGVEIAIKTGDTHAQMEMQETIDDINS